MYAVSQEFLDQMKAPVRRVNARVTIDYTDPVEDQTIEVTASEQADASYPSQTADFATEPTYKWAALDGSWVLDGTYHLAPSPEDAYLYQMGWWSAQVADAAGAFAEPYPTLILTHPARPVLTYQVIGDSLRGEWPTEFSIRLYGPDGTLLQERVVGGNTEVHWSEQLDPPVLDVTRQELEIRAWSHPGHHAKILEFFTSLQETYEGDELMEVRLLEEREPGGTGVGIGGVSSNEITVLLANRGERFDVTNTLSPFRELLRPNRRVRAWLGLRGAGDLWGDGWYAPFDRDLAVARRDGSVLEPLPGYVTTLRPGEGRFGGAVAVEEGTTNLVDFDVAFRSWSSSNSNMASLTTKTGRHSFRVQGTSTVPGAYSYIYPAYATTNVLHSASSWVRNLNSKPLEVRLRIRDGSNGESLSDIAVVVVPPGQELPIRVAPHSPVSLNQVTVAWYVYSDPDDGTVDAEIYMCQLEAKPFPTSFVDGTRAEGKLEYPQPLNKKRGTMSVWINPHVLRNWNNFFNMSNISTGRFLLYFNESGGARWEFGPSSSGPATPAGSVAVGRWDMHTLTWDADVGEYRYYLNGQLVGSKSYVEPDSLPPVLPTVNNYGALIDELLILPYAVGEEHIARLYAQTRPLYDEWVPLGTYWSTEWDTRGDVMEAQVRARDRLELLRRTSYRPGPLRQNVSLYALAEDVLADAELAPEFYSLDPALQDIVVPWGWVPPGSHRDALRVIAEAGLARVYSDRDGILRVQRVAQPGGSPVVEITADDYFPPLRAPASGALVANRVVVTTQPLVPATSAEEVYRATVAVPVGQTVTVLAEYATRPVIDPAASLEIPPAGVSIVGETYGAASAEVQIQNAGVDSADVTLTITGRPLSVEGGERVVLADEQSIKELSLLVYEAPSNPLVQTTDRASAIAQAILAASAQQRRDVELEWRGNPALEVGDLVRVVGMDAEVVRQEMSWAGALSARLTGRRVTS